MITPPIVTIDIVTIGEAMVDFNQTMPMRVRICRGFEVILRTRRLQQRDTAPRAAVFRTGDRDGHEHTA